MGTPPVIPFSPQTQDPTATTELREHDLKTANEAIQAREAYIQRMLVSMTILARCQSLASGDLDETLRVLTKMLVRTLYVDRASIGFFDPTRQNLRCIRTFDERLGGHSSGECLQACQAPEFFDAIQRGRTVEVEDAQKDPRTSALSENDLWVMDVRALMMVPIKQAGRCWGILCCQQANGTRRWSQEERQFAAFVSSLVTLGLDVRDKLG